MFLDDASEIALSKEIIDSAKFTRLNIPFKPVYEMAKMFFYNINPDGYHGNDTICSFLIPLNELYEYYLYKVLDNMSTNYNAKFQNSSHYILIFYLNK